MEKNNSNNIIKMVDTTPRKRILWTGVSICTTKNAITEIQDNLVDLVAERLKKGLFKKNCNLLKTTGS